LTAHLTPAAQQNNIQTSALGLSAPTACGAGTVLTECPNERKTLPSRVRVEIVGSFMIRTD
jgi:hypothetical protein